MRPTDKPFSEACLRNRDPILAVLRRHLATAREVLEIASGTGQHAVYFGRELPHLRWQTSDLPARHPGIRAWLAEAGLANVLPPLALDINDAPWPVGVFDAIFNANTLHIVSWPEVERLFRHVGRHLKPGGRLFLYGPFNYAGQYTSASNARFDAWLRASDPRSGIRDFEAISALAADQGLALLEDIPMPANNQMLIWEMKTADG